MAVPVLQNAGGIVHRQAADVELDRVVELRQLGDDWQPPRGMDDQPES